ncbi:MAG: hypothetical protein HYY36_00090, partial [Gammaproteobacteria bacterium]|nr:hypothetical protein [Gammaproteobacteria bacterium]
VQKSNWFERDLLDIRGDRIQEIRIDHGDGAALSLRRESADADFVIDGIPEGKEAKSEVVVSRMETILENFFVDGARAADKLQFPQSATRITVKTLDGLTAAITAAEVDELPMAKITFQYEAPPKAADKGEGAQVRIPGAASTEAADEKVETGIANEVQKAGEKQEIGADGKARGTQEKQETDDDKAQKEDVAAEVEKLQQAVSGWVFEIPQFKFELLTRRLEDLVQDRPPADQKKDEAPAQ